LGVSANEIEFRNYIRLLEEVHADFQSKGLLVSVALSPDSEFSLKDFAVVDRIHIMSYDRGARHSTYEQAVADCRNLLTLAVPREKLILGIPFMAEKSPAPYGRNNYAEIIELYHPAPDVDEVDGYLFQWHRNCQLKTCHAMSKNIGG